VSNLISHSGKLRKKGPLTFDASIGLSYSFQ